MPKYLLDTNILLRLSNPTDTQHKLATAAVATLLSRMVAEKAHEAMDMRWRNRSWQSIVMTMGTVGF
jgi:predicted nucleic acid-binding protein